MDTEIKFGYHNIKIGDTYTIPGQKLLEDDSRVKLIKEILYNYKKSNPTLVDLGSLEGGYSLMANKLGFKVSSVEGRYKNCEKIQWLKKLTGANFDIIWEDVKDIDKFSKKGYDVTLCLGLLYHLDNPVDFLTKVASKTNDLLVLSTHYSQRVDKMYDKLPSLRKIKKAIYKRLPFIFYKANYGLGKLEENEGLQGRWYWEYNKNTSDRKIDKLPASSLSNSNSFWLTKESLIGLLKDLNFSVEIKDESTKHDSALFICKKVKA